MKTVVYIDSWKQVNKSVFANQLKLYDSLGTTVCLDNSLDGQETGAFLELVSDVSLDNTVYNINDVKINYDKTIEAALDDEDTLLVSSRIVIDEKSIREMEKVLNAAERHVFVIPRSDNGDIQSFPGPDNMFSFDERIKWLNDNMPEYTLMPCTFGECIFMKTPRIRRFVFSDNKDKLRTGIASSYESMALGMTEFSLQVHNYAYNTLCANHAYALGVNSGFENACENDMAQFNNNMFERYKAALEKYYKLYRAPAEKYGKCIGATDRKKKLLFYMPNVPAATNGSSIHTIGVLSGIMNSLPENDWEVTIAAYPKAVAYHHLNERFDCNIISPENMGEGHALYDVGLVPFHMCDKGHQRIMAEYCYKLIFWPLDLIMLRSEYINDIEFIRCFENIARYADGLLYFSNSVKADMEAYYNHIDNVKKIPSMVSYITYNETKELCEEEMPFDNYYLVMGNNYVHKMVVPALKKICNRKENFVVFGRSTSYEKIASNIVMMPSGGHSDAYMNALYKNCKALIFPSVYEGFGLPAVQAMNLGKDVFVMEMPVNHELEGLAPEFKGRIHFMNSLEELSDMIGSFEAENKPEGLSGAYERSWNDVGRDCIELLNKVINTPYDAEKMYSRRAYFE